MLQDGKITKQDKILLKISLIPIDIDNTKPDIIQVDNIRIVKYNTKDKTLSDYDSENYFINNFFKLNVDNGLLKGIGRNNIDVLKTYSGERKNMMIDVLTPNRRNKW